jgi:hypothetical protein
VLSGDGLHNIAQIREQVPSISNLDGTRCTKSRSLSVAPATVAADDLRLLVLSQPRGELCRRAVIQQIDGSVGLHIDEHGAVHPATTDRELVYPQDASWRQGWIRQTPHQLQQSRSAGGQPKLLTQALAWSAPECQPHLLQRGSQPVRPSGVARDHVRHLLSEGTAGATTIGAPEAADAQVQENELADDGLIGHAAGIATVHASRATTTQRAASRPTAVMQDQVYLVIGDQDTFDLQRLEMREQVSNAQTGASDARTVERARRQWGLPE